MDDVPHGERLVWITPTVGINPTNIVGVFHGRGGHIELLFVSHPNRQIREEDLTADGRALLFPRHHADAPGQSMPG